MANLIEQLNRCGSGRVCLIGVGNADRGDDAFGVRLAEELLRRSSPPKAKCERQTPDPSRIPWGNAGVKSNARHCCRVVIAGQTPERLIGRMIDAGFDHVIFLDAVEFGGPPGAAVFLDAREMASRFPQVSTHKLSLGLLAKCLEANGHTRAWLLGAQPATLEPNAQLTPAVDKTLKLLSNLLDETLAGDSTDQRPPMS